jgi:UDP-N-acetyl-2-amino-2-deoxyglucuronate dehydrogenase
MATIIETADALIRACDANNVKIFVVKQNRLNSTMQLLKRAIDKGRFGRIYLAESNVFGKDLKPIMMQKNGAGHGI